MTFKPKYNLIEELKWRNLHHQDIPGTEDLLMKQKVIGYIGFDPTADSLHIGNMVPIMLLIHLQRSGHQPIALVGGATGMVGDPSGKKDERQLMDIDTLDRNIAGQKAQLKKLLDFDLPENPAMMVNNYDWFKEMKFLDFIRDVGKHISVNYMMAKESVKNRLEAGMSFTEFTYQLVQGYDFYYLHQNHDCLLQMGGSDQWGNIVTGTELVRRKSGESAFALTAPLITKSDGSKFGKSEGGNIWLDKTRTSPYRFYQFWFNTSDEDAERYIKIFTLLPKEEIEKTIAEHQEAPHLRLVQKQLAQEITKMVHGEKELEEAIKASGILFSKTSVEEIEQLSESNFLSIFDGLPKADVSEVEGIDIVTMLVEKAGFLPSNGEARRALKENSVSVNRSKVTGDYVFSKKDLINGKYIVIQRGKKKHFLVSLVS
jgi:tyrosyl-tRNA synthetase